MSDPIYYVHCGGTYEYKLAGITQNLPAARLLKSRQSIGWRAVWITRAFVTSEGIYKEDTEWRDGDVVDLQR